MCWTHLAFNHGFLYLLTLGVSVLLVPSVVAAWLGGWGGGVFRFSFSSVVSVVFSLSFTVARPWFRLVRSSISCLLLTC